MAIVTLERPNFTSQDAEEAEFHLRSIVDALGEWGFKESQLELPNEQIIETVTRLFPDRVQLVGRQAQCSCEELVQLSQADLIDKMLGIDLLCEYEGCMIGIDVGTGKASTLVNKRRKMQTHEDLYTALGINHTFVVGMRREPTVDDVMKIGVVMDEAIKNGIFYGEIRL